MSRLLHASIGAALLLAFTAVHVPLGGAHAAVIADSGVPINASGGGAINPASSKAGQFTLTERTIITSLSIWSNIATNIGMNIEFSIYSDGGTQPLGQITGLSETIFFGQDSGFDYRTASGLSWVLDPGTYWAVFGTLDGNAALASTPSTAPNSGPAPFIRFSESNSLGVWSSFAGRNFGMIVNGDPAPVPLPAALPLFVAGLGGMAFIRRRKKAEA